VWWVNLRRFLVSKFTVPWPAPARVLGGGHCRMSNRKMLAWSCCQTRCRHAWMHHNRPCLARQYHCHRRLGRIQQCGKHQQRRVRSPGCHSRCEHAKWKSRYQSGTSRKLFPATLQSFNSGIKALSRISPRVKVRVSVSIVYRIATGGYSWIWPALT